MSVGSQPIAPATRIILRAVTYYVVLIGGASLLWRVLPHHTSAIPASLETLFGGAPLAGRRDLATSAAALDEVSLGIAVAVAMLGAVLLALPVAWVYLLTRAKRGYQQSVVQLLIILPAVVAGIVLLVKYSITLAFSLAGIVAAVRFRNTLEDSKDAVYVFLATAVGLAAAVNLPVAAVLSIGFNATVLVLWWTDFGDSPVELDGRIAQKRLKRARQLARTGTFVARMDDEVFGSMTREQLEGVADRAWRRARAGDDATVMAPEQARLRISTRDLPALREALDARLDQTSKQWHMSPITSVNGVEVVDYVVQLKKKTSPDDILALARVAGSDQIIDIELR
jgi:hypothetical protein